MSTRFPETEWRSYDVAADSLADAASQISGLPEAATTEWFPRYTFTTNAAGRLLEVDVEVPAVVTMPRWTGYGNAPFVERDEWDRFCAALRAHEQGHLDLVREHLQQVDSQLAGQTPARAAAIWAERLAALDAASRAFDRATNHGLATGTMVHVLVP